MLKKYFSTFLLIVIPYLSCGQSAGKIGGISSDGINKIGQVHANNINKTGNVSVQVIYKNCKEIKQNNPGATDGIYTIDPDGSGTMAPFSCFCDMTTDGGGWTMVGYYKHPANYQDFMLARSDASYGTEIANPNSSSAWTDWRVLNGVAWPVQFAVILDQPAYSTWGDLNAKVIYRVKNRNVMPNYGTSQDLTTGDNLYYKFSFPSGYSDVGSSSASSDIHWSPLTAAGTYLIVFHNTAGLTAFYGSGVPGGNNTWNHSARMFVR